MGLSNREDRVNNKRAKNKKVEPVGILNMARTATALAVSVFFQRIATAPHPPRCEHKAGGRAQAMHLVGCAL